MQPADRIAPVAPRYSLLTSARDRSGDQFGTDATGASPAPPEGTPAGNRPLSVKWRTGIRFNSISCSSSGNWKRCPGTNDAKTATGPVDLVDVDVFFIYTLLECAWALMSAEDPLDSDAVALTDARSAWGVSRALWLGDGLALDADQPTLRNSAVDATVGGPMDLDDAVAVLLSRYEAKTSGLGGAVLHVPSILIPSALNGGGTAGTGKIATVEGNLYRGPGGSVVSPGPGYPSGPSNPGPDGYGPEANPAEPANDFLGTDEDEIWVYVTGPVEYALGESKVLDEPETRRSPRQNSYAVEAIRPAIVRFEPCTAFAARVATPIAGVS